MTFVDTNYLLRFLIKDVPAQHTQAKRLFTEAAKGKVELITSTVVVFEVVWVLTSFYELTKADTLELLRQVLLMNFLVIPERPLLTRALDLFEEYAVSFEDCYNVAFAEAHDAVPFKTFDRKLAQVIRSL